MGLFDFLKGKPYKMNSLSIVEQAAVEAAMEAAIHFGADGRNLNIAGALKSFKKGAVNKDELTTIIACVTLGLGAMKGSDDPDRSTELQKKQIAVVSMALALDKLRKML